MHFARSTTVLSGIDLSGTVFSTADAEARRAAIAKIAVLMRIVAVEGFLFGFLELDLRDEMWLWKQGVIYWEHKAYKYSPTGAIYATRFR